MQDMNFLYKPMKQKEFLKKKKKNKMYSKIKSYQFI